jgi:hypothetical protein
MKNNTIGYIKYKQYIITIEIENYDNLWFGITKPAQINDNLIKRFNLNINNIEYITKKYKVVYIEDILGNTYNKIDYYTINEIKIFNDFIIFYKSKEVAFNKNFINDKQYLLFNNGYSGLFRTYKWNGHILDETYIINENMHIS